MRPDWEAIKVDIMHAAIKAKFKQHAYARAVLLSTGNTQLIEASPNDIFWGCGLNGSGMNQLGLLLQLVRDELRAENGG